MSCEYVRDYYKVPAELGRLVDYGDRSGVIAEDRGNYVGVNFNDCKPGDITNIHSRDPNLSYLGMGKIRSMTRSQKRYHDYIHSETDLTFAEWMGFEK